MPTELHELHCQTPLMHEGEPLGQLIEALPLQA
jgi:hypothetical protein